MVLGKGDGVVAVDPGRCCGTVGLDSEVEGEGEKRRELKGEGEKKKFF